MPEVNGQQNGIYFSEKETSPNVQNTTCLMSGEGKMNFPSVSGEVEMNRGKLGTGQHGTKSEVTVAYVEFSYECQRLSELAFFSAYCFGKGYTPVSTTDSERHPLIPFGTTESLAMPTFTMEYGPGTASGNDVITGCVVTEISISGEDSGTGVVTFTAKGFGNAYSASTGVFVKNANGSMSSGSLDALIAVEPLVTHQGFNFYIGDTFDPFTTADYVVGGSNIATGEADLSGSIKTFSFTYSNTMAVRDAVAGGSNGVCSRYTRGNPTSSVEITFRENSSLVDFTTLTMNNTKKVMELNFALGITANTDQYGLVLFLHNVQYGFNTSEMGTPNTLTVPVTVQENATGKSCEIAIQNLVTVGYTA